MVGALHRASVREDPVKAANWAASIVKQLRTAHQVTVNRAYLFLTILVVVLSALVFFDSAAKVNHIRDDFCDWTTQHYAIDLSQAQTRVRVAAEKSDAQLEQKLGC
jgi:hypothetical protein